MSYELERKGPHIKFNFTKPAQLDLFGTAANIEAPAILIDKVEDSTSKELPEKLKRPYERLLEYGLIVPQAKLVIEKIPLNELNPILYKLNKDIIVDKIYLKFNRTPGQHSVLILKEKFQFKYKLWLKES